MTESYNGALSNGNSLKNGKSSKHDDEDAVITEMSNSYRAILESVGENVMREGLLKTPQRASKALLFFTKGYTESLSGKFIRRSLMYHKIVTEIL